jgi:hypothetical protein
MTGVENMWAKMCSGFVDFMSQKGVMMAFLEKPIGYTGPSPEIELEEKIHEMQEFARKNGITLEQLVNILTWQELNNINNRLNEWNSYGIPNRNLDK